MPGERDLSSCAGLRIPSSGSHNLRGSRWDWDGKSLISATHPHVEIYYLSIHTMRESVTRAQSRHQGAHLPASQLRDGSRVRHVDATTLKHNL